MFEKKEKLWNVTMNNAVMARKCHLLKGPAERRDLHNFKNIHSFYGVYQTS
jgi:hypothetical protein